MTSSASELRIPRQVPFRGNADEIVDFVLHQHYFRSCVLRVVKILERPGSINGCKDKWSLNLWGLDLAR